MLHTKIYVTWNIFYCQYLNQVTLNHVTPTWQIFSHATLLMKHSVDTWHPSHYNTWQMRQIYFMSANLFASFLRFFRVLYNMHYRIMVFFITSRDHISCVLDLTTCVYDLIIILFHLHHCNYLMVIYGPYNKVLSTLRCWLQKLCWWHRFSPASFQSSAVMTAVDIFYSDFK